jgi:hypothetical protein
VKVAGLDLSITATGVCHSGEDGQPCWHLIKTKGTKDDRLVVIKNQIREYVRGCGFVLIEGYLNQSMSAGITGMVHGAVRSMLIEEGITYGTLPPSSLKKYASGSGGKGTDKRVMALEAYKRGGVEFRDDNTCDAWWLWVAASDQFDQAPFALPMLNRESLTKIHMEV